MQVTHENIEAYLLDFSEGNLSEQEVAVLHAFINQNPEYQDFLEDLDDLPLVPDTENQSFNGSGLKVEKGTLPAFAEELCFKKAEGTLTPEEEARYAELHYTSKAIVEHTAYYEKARLQPDLSVVMPNKGSLKKVIPLFNRAWAVAASVAVLLVAAWFYFQGSDINENNVTKLANLPTKKNVQVPQLEVTTPTLVAVPKPQLPTPKQQQPQRKQRKKVIQPILENEIIEEQFAEVTAPEIKDTTTHYTPATPEETQPEPVLVASAAEEVTAGELLKSWSKEKARSIVPEGLKENGKLTFASAVEGISGNKIQIDQTQSPSGKRSFRVAFGKFGIEKIGS